MVLSGILRLIRVGTFRPGDRLPSEFELAQQFDVAIGTLRRSLDELRARRVIETRRGRYGGSFVIRIPAESGDEFRERLRKMSVTELRDMADQHVAISSMIARLCCQRADDEELDRLRGMARELASAESVAETAMLDSRFHVELGAVGRSPRLMHDEVRLQGEYCAMAWELCGSALPREDVIRQHEDIIGAIGAGDVHRAEELAEAHVRGTVYVLIQAKLALRDDDGD